VNALDDVVTAPAGALATAIRTRRLSSAEVVDAHLRRIDNVNPRVNAIVPVDYRCATPAGEETPNRFDHTLPFSLCGWPCVVVRAGTSADGMPVGVQVVARSFREDVALAVGRHIERTMGGWRPAPG